MPLFLLIFFLVLAVGVSFICSILEAVLLSVTPSYVRAQSVYHPRRGAQLEMLKQKIDQPLAAILTLNTIAHTVGAAGVGAQAAVLFNNQYIGVTSAVLTLIILVFSEILPKTIGATYWRQLGLLIAPILIVLISLLKPFIWLSDMITKLIGKQHHGHEHIREEIAAMAHLGSETGQLADNEGKIINSLLSTRDTKLKNIMTPRTVLFSVDKNMTVNEYLSLHADAPFSRILLSSKEKDNVIGFVHKHDILMNQQDGNNTKLGQLLQPLYVVPDTAAIPALFQSLLEKRNHISLVVDEYGDVQGIVTMEDLVETLLGIEIVDEQDKIADMQRLAKARWIRHQRNTDGIIEKPE
ncbi:CNNM domain-containing protein [Motilimonas cestriensis]|uniref:CNNM domain-containing protein n=1 Tax=Motilimonas cestriensis TaxID=2742685 RepID=UPI003D056983